MTKQHGTPGPRAVWPGVVQSPSLARCGLVANVLFPARLLAIADDQGRIQASPRQLLARALENLVETITVPDVETAVVELVAAGCLLAYEVKAVPYLQIVKWWAHQSGMRRAYPSKHPAPPGWVDVAYGYGDLPTTYEAAIRDSAPHDAADRGETPHDAALERHRAAILALLDADPVGWRSTVMATQLRSDGVLPLLLARPGIRFAAGACRSCGELSPVTGLRCAACAAAAIEVVKRSGLPAVRA